VKEGGGGGWREGDSGAGVRGATGSMGDSIAVAAECWELVKAAAAADVGAELPDSVVADRGCT
jgi:hypothetical protein